MALSTLKALVALGYQISVEEQEVSSMKFMDLPPEKYRMSNGYCPRPLDVEAVVLPTALKGLVDRLAENTHNIWASKRIHEGWTYGKANVHIYTYIHRVALWFRVQHKLLCYIYYQTMQACLLRWFMYNKHCTVFSSFLFSTGC